MSCVNTTTTEFKERAKELKVHPDYLESILYKYLNTPGMENYVPSDLEIKKELNGKPFEADVKTLQWYNKNFLYKPAIFSTHNAAIEQAAKYREFLPDEAVNIYRDNNGNYVVSVGTPMLNGVPVAIDNTMVDHYLENLDENNPYHTVFKTLVDFIGKENITVRQATIDEVEDDKKLLEKKPIAIYSPSTKSIIFFPENFNGDVFLSEGSSSNVKSRRLFKVLTHEMVHQMAFHAVAEGEHKTEAARKFHEEVNSLYKEALEAVGEERAKDFYGFTDAQEFIAEAFTDAHLQKELASIKSKTGNKSLWRKFVDLFKSLFDLKGLNIEGSILADILVATEQYMTNVKAEEATLQQEKDLADEVFLEEMESSGIAGASGYRSPTLDKAIKHKDNKKDSVLYYLKSVGTGNNRLYAVHIPSTSESSVETKKAYAEAHLRKIGLSEYWTVGDKVHILSDGSKVMYIGYTGPRNTSSSNKPANLFTVDFTEREQKFLRYLDKIRPDLAEQVRTGLQDIKELMKHENEINTFFEPEGKIDYTPEMNSIKQQAIANGIFMKAPNGNPTNLNERQWLQVRTKNFINWFGDWINNPSEASKVVDENGEPLVVYHASDNNDFNIFDKNKIGSVRPSFYGKGFYFTSDAEYANVFADKKRSFFLNARHPYHSTNDIESQIEFNKKENDSNWVHIPGDEFSQYDREVDEIVVFESNQIKSATDNNGDFSTTNDNINEEEAWDGKKKFEFDFTKQLKKKETWRDIRGGEIVATLPQEAVDKIAEELASYMEAKRGGEIFNDVMNQLFPDGKPTTSTKILDEVINSSEDKTLVELAKLIKKNLKEEVPVSVSKSISSRGKHTSDNKVFIAPRAANGNTRGEAMESASKTVVHELAHAVTAEKLDTNKELRKEVAEIMGQLSDYMNQNGIDQYVYALKNEKEFIAEFMSQPLFREALKQMPSKIEGKPSNFFQRILNIIKKALGIKSNTTLFDEANRVLNDIFKAEVEDISEEIEDNLEIAEEDQAPSTPIVTQDEVRNILAANNLSVNTPVTKIISGIQTGVDTIGLDVAAALGLGTGGTAPAGFLREQGIDSKDADTFKAMGVVEITPEQQTEYSNRTGRRDPYTARTELNVRDSDGTVYFSTSADKRGEMATHRAAREWNKPFLVNPSAAELREWIAQNNIKTLNVAGNRGSKLTNGSEITQTLVEALTTPTAPEGNVQLGTELDNKIQAFSGEFEGATNSLVGIVPEDLLRKVEDYIMSDGEIGLTIAEAQEFLNLVEAAHIRAQEGLDTEEKVINKVRQENQDFLERNAEVSRQIDNLLNSSILSASEVRHIAEQVVYWISDAITEYMNNPESLFKNFDTKRTMTEENGEQVWNEENKKKDIEKVKNIKSRADLVRFIGVANLVNFARSRFDLENNDFATSEIDDKAELVYNNWDAIMLLASDAFLSIEDFSIVSSRDGKTREVGEKSQIEVDNLNQSNMESDVAETEGNLQEHWQVETKTIDILTTMSQIVRQALAQCYILKDTGQRDPDTGKPVYENVKSEFGIKERIHAREATNSILRWTQGALDLAQMIEKLKEKEATNPWVSQIIERLEDTSGKEVDFQAQFFSTFSKHFQPYSVIIEEKGKFKSINVNENPALTEAMKEITSMYKAGIHPLFTNDGVNKERLNELKESYEEIGKFFVSGKNIEEVNAEERTEIARTLGYVSSVLGFIVTPDIVEANLTQDNLRSMQQSLKFITNILERNADNSMYNAFEFGDESINGNVKSFLSPIMETFEDTAISAFYDSGKMYQSYITPSYTTKLFRKFSTKNPNFDEFVQSEYGEYAWFKDPETSEDIEAGWRNEWLKLLITDDKAREAFKHKVQLNFNKKNYMRDMDDMEYTLSVITEYFSEKKSDKESKVLAWFRVPMLSNKPSSEFIRFYSERGANYREILTSGFLQIMGQELSRIQTVKMRNLSKKDANFIKNFDTNGKKFMFLDFMNDYLTGELKNSELGKLINDKVEGKTVDDSRLEELAREVILDSMEARAEKIVQSWKDQGLFKGVEKIAGIDNANDDRIAEELKNFVWNDTFAAMNIMQLTITDIAFYKDAEDLQKRLAQIHAPGVRGNISATDYGLFDADGRMISKPRSVTDGKFRTIKLTDFDGVTSNIIENVNIVFARKIAQAPEAEKAALIALRDSLTAEEIKDDKGNIIQEAGAFRKINVADAQGYSCPTSYRKKALIFGKWSRQAEDIYQKLMKGEYTYSDLQVAFQPLKPFVYSQIEKEAGVEGVPMEKIKVPVQFKNSEYLLIMADALLRSEDTGRPNLLRAIYDVMEASHFEKGHVGDMNYYRTDGIDTVQFESTMKSGLSGKVNLNDFVKDANGEAVAKARLEAMMYKEDGINYNTTTVDEVPFEDYCLQQEVPDHFKEHEQAHGSQIRYIIPSELETTDAEGNAVMYNLEGKMVSAQEFKDKYENTIADSIEESINDLKEELGLTNVGTIKDTNIALSRILQKEILSNPRYGVDLLQACTVDPVTGRFRIPLGDPIQSKRVEQLLNSIIKSRVNKQTIAGGPVVQVTNFGTSRELNIRFKNKKGGLLKTRSEWEKAPEGESYESYIKENQGGIAHFEVFAPIYANGIFEDFMNEDGSIDVEAIEAINPDLLKMIGYRIPTEDKYSMAPLKIVGFLPREAGDGIMLPADITLLTGSDFDVDKMYLMRKDIDVKRKSRRVINDSLYEIMLKSAERQGAKVNLETKQFLSGEVKAFLDKVWAGDKNFTTPNEKLLWKYYKRIAYRTVLPKSGRRYRNNLIVDMTYEVLTHETSADKMLNPGGFDPQKKMGYLVEAYKLVGDESKKGLRWEDMEKMSIDELKNLTSSSKNLSYIDTHVQFYKQNSAAGSLIGIFAVNRIAHAVLESGSEDGSAMYKLNVDNICKISKPFSVAGMEFGGNMDFDMRYDTRGRLIGKVMGSFVAASVDAVKDPILNLMNINNNTANILNTLVRMGMPFENATLFLSQSVISEVLAEYSRENITGFKFLSSIIEDRIANIEKSEGFDKTSIINDEDLTEEEMVEGLKENADVRIQYKVLKALANFQKLAGAMQMPTFATRFNSISSAVGPLIIDNLIMKHKKEKLSEESNVLDADGEPVDMNDILRAHPIIARFSEALDIAKQIFGNMPANSSGFKNILDSTTDTSLEYAIFGNRKTLSSLSDFYQSYLVMRGGVVDVSKLNYYVGKFPKEFVSKDYKKAYPDNAFIQAIKLGTDKNGRATLQIDTTGLDTQQKERLSNGWTDLHKANPELSQKLFNYAFFRGGIGFNPKSFMSLVPVYVKERIPGYVDTFRVLPSTIPDMVIDQFVRNNWDNNRLVPRKQVSLQNNKDGTVSITSGKDLAELNSAKYFKMKIQNKDKLFRLVNEEEGSATYEEVAPLGSNKDYLEISESDISSALEVTAEAIEDPADSKDGGITNSPIDEADNPVEQDRLKSDKIEELLYDVVIMKGIRSTVEEADAYITNEQNKWRNASDAERARMERNTKKFIENRFRDLKIEYNENLINEVFEKFC